MLLQTLNILENVDLKSMGYNSARYIHALYQAMNLAFADRDFYYGDPYFPPVEPIKGLLSKDYARARLAEINWQQQQPADRARATRIRSRAARIRTRACSSTGGRGSPEHRRADANVPEFSLTHDQAFVAGTTSIEAADSNGWVVSVTPSGGWVPAFIAGTHGVRPVPAHAELRDGRAGEPVQRARAGQAAARHLEPELALRDGKPFLSFAVQGGDAQDQNLLQFFLNFVEFGMSVQQAVEAANVNSYQMHDSFGDHDFGAGPPRRARRHAAVGPLRARAHGLPHRNLGEAPRARSTRSTSTNCTAACGAARAISARTTASPSDHRPLIGPLPIIDS